MRRTVGRGAVVTDMPAATGLSEAATTYRVRASALEHPGAWRLLPDALELTGGPGAEPGLVQRFAYRDMVQVRLSYRPSRFDTGRYACGLALRSGQHLTIVSTHYAGVASFEDRAASYTPFVRELIGRIAAANPQARFRGGRHPAAYLAEHGFLLAMIVVLLLVLLEVGVLPFGDIVMVKLGIVLATLPLAFVYARRNWPRTFDPRAIPADVLPMPSDPS